MSDNRKKKYRKFDELIVKLESDPKRKAALDEARKWVRETFYPNKHKENTGEQQDSRID